MKLCMVLLISVLLSTLSYAQTGGAKSTGNNDEKIIRQWEQDWAKALMSGDTNQLKKTSSATAANYTFTDPAGRYEQWKDMRKVTPVIKFERAEIRDMTIHLYPNTATATYVRHDKGKINNEIINGANRWLDVFVKLNGKWTRVATQGTPVAGKQ
jgi:hypothetical protein